MTSRKELIAVLSTEVSAHISDHIEVLLMNAVKTCLNCRHWSNDANEVCTLCNCRPPAKVIAFGCESYVDVEEIPY